MFGAIIVVALLLLAILWYKYYYHSASFCPGCGYNEHLSQPTLYSNTLLRRFGMAGAGEGYTSTGDIGAGTVWAGQMK